ncbi:MAG: hypothetical protein JST55_03510 [Bacteroidetes bacterium]|nr:hypothetical protein [Bacteroidota bacterium]
MNQIKAFRILSTLSKEEFAEFDRFINSPFFNRSKDLTKLFYAVNKYYPIFESPKLTNENIYKKLYPGKTFNEGTIRNLFTDLGNLAERFLGFINHEGSFDFGLKLLSETNARYLDKEFNKNYNNLYDENELIEDSFYKKNLNKYHLVTELDLFNDRRKIKPKNYSRNNLNEPLFAFFFAEFIFEHSSYIARVSSNEQSGKYDIVKLFFDCVDVAKLISGLKKNNSPHYKDIELYYSFFLTTQNKDGNFFFNFERSYKLFKERIDKMTKQAQYRMYIWLRNLINTHAKIDDKELLQVLFQTGKEMVAKEIALDETGKMSAFVFVNLIHGAILVKELDWASDFLENKINLIAEDAKSDFYNYYKAKILSRQKKYIESNEALLKIDKEDILFKIDSKVLRMINYFELGFTEAGFSQAETLKQYNIRNETANGIYREKCTNFLKYYLILLKKKSGAEDDISHFKKELLDCAIIRNKDWLLEKFEELS